MIGDLIERARRRFYYNAFLRGMSFALCVAICGIILLLILGTQLLDWRWLAGLGVASSLPGAWLARKRVPSAYRTAQAIDHRLGLADTISTALFFAGRAGAPALLAQRKQAERVAAHVDLGQAIPLQMPRSVYTMGTLALIASGLFALRYGVERTIDLRPPLARAVMQSFGWDTPREAANRSQLVRGKAPDLSKTAGVSVADRQAQDPRQLDPAPDSALDTTAVPDVSVNGGSPGAMGKTQSESEGSEPGEGEQGKAAERSDANAGDGTAPSGGKPVAGSSGADSSLMGKLRDAMSNLLSKMRQPPNGGPAEANQPAQGQPSAAAQNGNKGDGPKDPNGKSAEAQDGSESGQPENAQGARGQGKGQSTDQQAANQPGGGIGRQDGNKDTKLAEQLMAMGKISEIIGKRSANVSGEVSVEVQSSNPQLRTPYSKNSSAHQDIGGEISRDEVPLVFQQYVQQYFAEVRKQAESHKEVR